MIEFPSSPTLNQIHAVGNKTWRYNAVGWELANLAVTIPKPEDFGAVGTGIVDDTDAMLDFFNNPFGFGRLTPGATYLIDGGEVTVPANTHFWGPRSATIKNNTATGKTLDVTGDFVTLDGFTIDGGNPSDTVANGFLDGHHGVYVTGTNSVPRFGINLKKLRVKNCGYSGIEARCLRDSQIDENHVSRCGVLGVIVWSPNNVWITRNKVSTIFPGETPGDPGSNCYGIAVSNFGGETAPVLTWMTDNYVENVPWEGMDEHNGQYIYICRNTIVNCGTGIAVEHHLAGYAAFQISVCDNIIHGMGAALVKDGVTFKSQGGVLAVGGIVGEQGAFLTINGNKIDNTGDTRSPSGDGGAISIRNWRVFTINSNQMYFCSKNGIIGTHSSTDSNIHGTIIGNTIDDTQTVDGVARDIFVSGRTYARIGENMTIGNGDGVSQQSTPDFASQIADNYSPS